MAGTIQDLFTSLGKEPEAPNLNDVLDLTFEVVFGPRPSAHDYPDAATARREISMYDQSRKYFKGLVKPNYPDNQITAAVATLKDWGIGEPVFYQHRYGVLARFQGTPYTFTPDENAVVGYTHVFIAVYQSNQIKNGIKVLGSVHPFVPEYLKKRNAELPEPGPSV